jgi:DNA invertase Pin-like site-specific DNA recombinase
MVTQRFVSYCRVSTARQGRSGLGLEAQRQAVAAYLGGGSGDLVGEFVEVESGKNSDRPQLALALVECRRRKAKLLVAKLDRLARDVHFISGLMKSGVPFVVADTPHATPLELHMRAAFAEEEARAISARTKAALQAAKARGTVLGNPRIEEAREGAALAIQAGAGKHAADVLPIIRDVQAKGAETLREIAEELNKRGTKTARGGDWHASSVRNVLVRKG